MIRMLALACICALLFACSKPVSETTTSGAAERVVSLAPHLSEMMYAIGAGDRLVGVSSWSDYPREVLELPEPYAGQRGRVVRMLACHGSPPPKFGPKKRILPMRSW